MRWRPDRRLLAGLALVAWGGAIALLALRRHSRTDAQLLARGALDVAPATYFYVVAQDTLPIGYASSSIDTTASGFTAREMIRVRALIAHDSQTVAASSVAYLSRGLALDSFAISISDQRPLHEMSRPQRSADVTLPSLASMALMLTRTPHVGANAEAQIYNPLSGQVERVTLGIAAESLFSVVDSAVFDSTRRQWTAAHLDTVRSWKIVAPSKGISAWVDAEGRIVAASGPGGASVTRTAYEIATLNQKLRIH